MRRYDNAPLALAEGGTGKVQSEDEQKKQDPEMSANSNNVDHKGEKS